MPDAYTRISKPIGTPYTNVNVQGKQQYDDPNLLYDDPTAFYDSVNTSAYTKVAKPSGTALIKKGMTTGLLIPLTYSQDVQTGDPYTRISKPTT